jgi:hypothetical protein
MTSLLIMDMIYVDVEYYLVLGNAPAMLSCADPINPNLNENEISDINTASNRKFTITPMNARNTASFPLLIALIVIMKRRSKEIRTNRSFCLSNGPLGEIHSTLQLYILLVE